MIYAQYNSGDGQGSHKLPSHDQCQVSGMDVNTQGKAGGLTYSEKEALRYFWHNQLLEGCSRSGKIVNMDRHPTGGVLFIDWSAIH